jgi:hypothetical protein
MFYRNLEVAEQALDWASTSRSRASSVSRTPNPCGGGAIRARRPPAGGDRCALPGAGAFPGQDQPAGLCPPRGRGGGCGPGRNPGGMAEATTQNFFRSSRTPDRHETSPVFRLLAGAPCRSIAAALVSLHLALPAGGVPRRSAQRAKLGDAGGRSSWPGAWTRIRPTRVATPC